MPQPYHLWPDITIDGTPLSGQMESRLEQVIVHQHQHLPSMFMIAFHDPNRDVLKRLGANIGARVEITISPPGGSSETLMTGEVTGLEAEYDASRLSTMLRGYDRTHRLHRGTKTKTYLNMKDSDIVSQLASDNGLSPQVEETSTVHQHVSQANQSDWDFLKSRAREIGYEMGIDDQDQFYFRKPKDASDAPEAGDYQQHGDPLQLVFGDDLIEFRPRITSAEQVSSVNVRSWDPKNKQAIVGTGSAQTVAASLDKDRPSSLASDFGGKTLTLVNRPVVAQGSADDVAKAATEIVSGAFAEADGVAKGNPKLRAGSTISVGVVGDRFKGKYTLTEARHVFGENGYRTYFVVSGRQDRSLLGLASLGASNGHAASGGAPINGVVVATVSSLDDQEDKLGRVKVKLPWLADDYESGWARVTQLGAGNNRGAVWIPEVGDEVLVAFEHGDVNRPFVVGSLWNGTDQPPSLDDFLDTSGGKAKWRGFVSRKGHKIILSDDDGNERIDLISSDGKFKVTIDQANSEIHITSDGTVKVESKQDMTFESQGNVKISAQQGVSLEASGGALDLKGMTATLKSSTPSIAIDNGAGGKIELSGPQVNVNSGALQVI